MKKNIISFVIVGSVVSFANTYNVIVSAEHNDYKSAPVFEDTGVVSCSSYLPNENSVYKDTEFTQTGSGCQKEIEDQYGNKKMESISDITENKVGTLVLSTCNDIKSPVKS